MIASATKSLARFLLFKEGMDFKKGVACLMAAIVLGMTGTALAAQFVALMFNKAQNSVVMRLEAVSGATNYKILRSETEGSGHTEIGATPRPMFVDNNIEPGTTYYYIFVAVTPGGEVKSDEKSVTIPGQKKKILPPPMINKITPSVRSEMGKTIAAVGLAWFQERAHETMGFSVFRSENAGGPYDMIASPAPTDAGYTDTGVEVGKTYYYVMTALDMNMMETPYSAEVKAEVKAPEKKKTKKRRIRNPIPRATNELWRVHNIIEGKGGSIEFREPYDVEVNSKTGIVYGTATGEGHIAALKAATGEVDRYIGSQGDGEDQFTYLLGLGIGPDGRIYGVDGKQNSVKIFTPDGDFEMQVKVEPDPNLPDPEPLKCRDVAIDKDGNMYVLESGNSQIVVFSPDGGEIKRMGSLGNEDGQMLYPLFLTVNEDGGFAVANSGLNRIDFFDKEFNFLGSAGSRGGQIGQFLFMTGFAFDMDGNVLVADSGPATVQGYDMNYEYQFTLGNADGTGVLPLTAPKGMAVDSQNVLYVVEGMIGEVTAVKLGPFTPRSEED